MTADPVWLVLTAGLALVLAVVAIVDWRTFRIPDALSLPLLAAGFAGASARPDLFPAPGIGHHLIGALVAFLLFAALGEALYRRTGQEALGLGDAKLFAAAGAWLGWQSLPMVLLIASGAGLVFALARGRRLAAEGLAFGPWLALGFLVMWIAAAAG